MLFDTHAHLNDESFDKDRDFLLASLSRENIALYTEIGTDLKSSRQALKLADKYDFIYAAVGIYPHETNGITDSTIDELKKLCRHKKAVAIGEIGLDYHTDTAPKEQQKIWFKKQINLAYELNMPICVHTRDAMKDTIDILSETPNKGGIIHCFSGSAESAQILVEMGFYISFAGPVTFKNARGLKAAAKAVPLEKILIETDSPYLTPEPFRGKRNCPIYVKEVCQKLAELKQVTYDEMERITFQNALDVYKINI